MDEASRERWRRLKSLSPLCFPFILWLAAFLFLRGHTGFWSDDYGHNLRGPDGSAPAMAFTSKWPLWTWGLKRDFFIRPLFYMLVPGWTTLVWNYPWVAHVIQALMHAGIVVLLWRLLKRLGVQSQAATCAALLFMVYSGHYEAVMWVSAFPTLLSVAIMLGVMFLTAQFASVRHGWWRVALTGVACFAACCLNEQAVISVVALPLVYRAAMPEADRFWSRRVVLRAVAPAIAGGVALLTYAYLLNSSAPPGFRGSDQTIVTAAAFPSRALGFLRQLGEQLLLVNYARGASSTGIATIRSEGAWSALFAAALLGSSWLFVFRPRAHDESCRDERNCRRGTLIALGLLVFASGWLPIVIMAGYPPDSRLRYWPFLGVAIALAAVVPNKLNSRAFRVAIALVLIAGVLPNIGAQAAYRSRWRRDRSEGDQLQALVPNPAPFTLFQPLSVGAALPPTGSSEFDGRFYAVWWYPWCTRQFIQRVYARDDIAATYWKGIGNPVIGANEEGLLYAVRLGPRYAVREGDGSRLSWDHVLPFIVDEAGRVRIVATVIIRGEDGHETRVSVPQAAGLNGVEFHLPRR